MKSSSEQDKARNHCQIRTGQESTVRTGQGKKTSSEQDKTRYHFQSRTRLHIIFRAGQGMTIRAGKARNYRQMHDGKAKQGLWWALSCFYLNCNPAFTLHLSYVSSSYFPDNALILLFPDLPTYSLFSLSLNCYYSCPLFYLLVLPFLSFAPIFSPIPVLAKTIQYSTVIVCFQ